MSLYYHKNTYELKDISNELISAWELNSNPKINEWILAPDKPNDSAIWDNGQWIVQEISIPQTISARQIRLWLIQHGFQLSQIDLAINSIEDDIARETVKIEWEYAPYIERNHPWLEVLASYLGLNSELIDQAFTEASQI